MLTNRFVYGIILTYINDRGAVFMISTGVGIAPCGKGKAAEDADLSPKFAFGRVENIGATVTEYNRCCAIGYWIFGSRCLIVP